MQECLAIRTAPPVTSAVTSSTTQTDATALSRTDSESMTKWNRYALSRSFWDFLRMDWNTRIDRLRWSTTAMIRSTPPAKNVKLDVVHSAERAAAVSAAFSASRVASCADMVPEFIITALAMLLIDVTPHRNINWSVNNGVLVIKDTNGNDVKLNVGTTWIGYASSNNGGAVK